MKLERSLQIAIIALMLGSMTCVLLLFAYDAFAQGQSFRYLVIRQAYIFERGNELPYEVIRPMAYDDRLGYVDMPIVNAHRAYIVVDLLRGNYAEVMESDSGCYVTWLLPEIGSDGQPHFASAEWILCES